MNFMKYILMTHLLMDEAGGDGGGGGGGTEPPTFQSQIPDGFADKGWMKGVDSFQSLFSKMDGAQNMIGQRNYIPAADAAVEHQNEFYEKLKPESMESYVFGEVADMPEGMKRTPEAESAVKQIFHDAGLSKHQAQLVQVGYDKFLAKNFNDKNEGDSATQNAEFDALTKDVFGDKREASLANSKVLLDKFAPEKMKGEIEKLGNNALTILASVLSAVHDEYMTQDAGGGGGDGGGSEGMTKGGVQDRMTKIREELGKFQSEAMHPNYKDLSAEKLRLSKWLYENVKKG